MFGLYFHPGIQMENGEDCGAWSVARLKAYLRTHGQKLKNDAREDHEIIYMGGSHVCVQG